jgi:hypothetical protein
VYEPNAAWVSDITYVPTDEGWLYLAGHKDLFTWIFRCGGAAVPEQGEPVFR